MVRTCVIFSAVSLWTTRNIIKDNEWTKTLLYKKKYISHFILAKGAHRLLLVWEIDGETYTHRGDSVLSHIFFRDQGGANACTPVQPVFSETTERLWSAACPSLGSDSLPPSKFYRVVITWSPSGYTPFGPDCHDALSSLCLLITTWQLVIAYRVTRNQPKIHVICYITHVCVSELRN